MNPQIFSKIYKKLILKYVLSTLYLSDQSVCIVSIACSAMARACFPTCPFTKGCFFKEIHSKIKFNLLIIGEGPELSALKEIAQKEKIDHFIYFAGAIYGEEVFRYLSLAKLSVIPGNVGLSAMHAMALGIPVISHDNFNIQMPEFEAIIEGVTGSFYEEGSIESLVSKIHYWVYNKEALEMAKEQCLSVIASRYHVDHQIKVIQECLKNL